MGTRRLLPLVLAVAGLLAVAALASHGRPLSTSRGGGPTAHFFDYVYTTFALAAVAIAVVSLYSILGSRWSTPTADRPRIRVVQLLASFAASLLFGWLLLHAHLHFGAHKHPKSGESGKHTLTPSDREHPNPASIRGARIRWDEIAIVAALLAAAGVAAFASRSSKPLKRWHLRPQEEVALALDESLDDLRSEPDLRRAIIAAYARMERTLGGAGIPRRPSETPFEYLARALEALDASAGAVTRLTDLFEWAKFSQHEPEPAMRDDAIDALVSLRDELRQPVEAAA
ncbi:MAG TPA: DUF4129 domain-containing protein [Gaiellaceae bacterium]|nr:DUF4129 domain-containing protein [Gaiellaceae bacterium]